MDKNTQKAIIFNIPLLAWFFLDMIGFTVGNSELVSQSYKEDGIFLIVYLIALVSFIFFKGKWKLVLPIWLSIWFLIQMYCHWYFTIFGPWDGMNRYFVNTIKLFPQTERYVPDLYHIVLHILILLALVCTIKYVRKSNKIIIDFKKKTK